MKPSLNHPYCWFEKEDILGVACFQFPIRKHAGDLSYDNLQVVSQITEVTMMSDDDGDGVDEVAVGDDDNGGGVEQGCRCR